MEELARSGSLIRDCEHEANISILISRFTHVPPRTWTWEERSEKDQTKNKHFPGHPRRTLDCAPDSQTTVPNSLPFRIYCTLLYSPRPAYIQGHSGTLSPTSIARRHATLASLSATLVTGRRGPSIHRAYACCAMAHGIFVAHRHFLASRDNLAVTVIVDGATCQTARC